MPTRRDAKSTSHERATGKRTPTVQPPRGPTDQELSRFVSEGGPAPPEPEAPAGAARARTAQKGRSR